ncbi:MAG: hypothetical protein Phog2KO_28200 [Phototrophicaceae bacterium]
MTPADTQARATFDKDLLRGVSPKIAIKNGTKLITARVILAYYLFNKMFLSRTYGLLLHYFACAVMNHESGLCESDCFFNEIFSRLLTGFCELIILLVPL